MSAPIGKGDLVAVVRWPCCGRLLGYHGTVQDHYRVPSGESPMCAYCGAQHPGVTSAAGLDSAPLGPVVPYEWLKRIPPLEELEGQPTEENLYEPA